MYKTIYKTMALVLSFFIAGSLHAQQKNDKDKEQSDQVLLPYSSIDKKNSTGDYFVLTGEDLKKYPSLDLRTAFSGLVPGLSITEMDGSTGMAAEERLSRNGITNKVNEYMRSVMPIYIVDDIPVDITEMPLDPEEIETVTFVKDIVGKAMYGPRAANGIIFIKTKRGKSNNRLLKVNLEAGISAVDRFPDWASGADYARLNNQARQNEGMVPLYDDHAISQYAKNNPYDLYYPSTNFKDMMFKNTKSYQRVNISSGGGNDFVKYYAYLGYSGEGDIFKLGSAADYNRLNARTNLDMQVNDFINVQVGLLGGLSIRRSPNYEYNTEDLLDFNNAINDALSISPIAFPVYASINEETGLPNYGVSSNFKYNPIGSLQGAGYYTEKGRSGRVNVAINIDLSHIIKGFRSRTYIDFMTYNQTRIGKNEQYAAYTVTPNEDKTDVTLTEIQKLISASGESKLHDYYFQRFSGYQTFSYDRVFNKNHHVLADLTYSVSKFTRDGVENPFCEQNTNLSARYTFKDRYTLHGVVTFAGTPSLIGSNQYRFFPSFGASWLISDEAFMKNLKFLDYLKLRAEAGMLGVLESNPLLFHFENKWMAGNGDKFGPHSSNQWMGNQAQWAPKGTYYNKWKNPNLDWEERKELTVGLDASLLQRRLAFSVTYYNALHDNQWVRPVNQFPLATGLLAVPYMNYNQTRYYGAELAARFTDHIGEFKYSIGATVSLPRSKRVRYDEPKYTNDYQYRTGKATDAYFGLVYAGRYASDEEAQGVNQLFDATLHKGDIKYVDLNQDGVIDNNDMREIGHTSPRVFYALNLAFEYKNFELTIVADGKAGYDIALTNRYFQNGWGDGNYSKFVMENAGGDYPRLTYHKVNNNFQNSDFWLRKGNFLKIQNVELAYNLPLSFRKKVNLQNARVFVRGANLLTISGIKDVDPESISAGVDRYPLYRTFTGGLSLTF